MTIKIKLLTAFIYTLFFMTGLNAQSDRQTEVSDRIKSQMVAYMTAELDLSPTEAEKFWPVYNEYKAKQRQIRKSVSKRIDVSTMSDEDANNWIANSLSAEEKETALKKDYYSRLKKILPPKKIVLLEQAENGFKKELLRKVSEKRKMAR